MKTNIASKRTVSSRSALVATALVTGLGSVLAGNAWAAAASVAVQTPTLLANQTATIVLTTGSVAPAGQVLKMKSLTTTGTHGTVTQVSSATVTYTPGTYYASLPQKTTATDSFAYCLADAAGDSACSTVTVTITGIAAAASTATASTSSASTSSASTSATSSTSTSSSTSSLSSTSSTSSTSSASTTSMASTSSTSTAATAVAVSVAAQTPTVPANQTATLVLTTNSNAPAGQVLKMKSLTTTGTHGTVTQVSSATVTYTPGAYYASLPQNTTATDSFAYCLADAAGGSACNTVTVTVSGTAALSSTAYTCSRNWYVSQNGSDKAAGTTASTPWLTLQHANDSGLLMAGDCVNVASGSYLLAKSLMLNHGGNANSPTGYVVYRSTTPQGAKIKAAATGMVDVVDVAGDYMIIDGFDIDGSNLGLVSSPFTTGSGIMATGHHFQAVNNLVHDCGGEGIGALYKDWYWIVGNTVYNNAHFNSYHMSGISIYEPRAVAFTATAADTNATYHIIVKNNVAHDNAETYVSSTHTDGNGIILDDFRNTQNAYTPYAYKSLVQGNTVYNNGGRGVHLFFTDNVTVDSNIVHGNNIDLGQTGTWRGELSNAFGSNNSWTNNQAAASSAATNVSAYNTAVLDGHSGAANVNVVWQNNANIDTRTGGKSYQIDDATRAVTFPLNNLLGKVL